jgi:elongation factor G
MISHSLIVESDSAEDEALFKSPFTSETVPIANVEVTVYDGKHHSVDSKEIAFVAAGKRAFQSAMAEAEPLVLEPLVSLELSVPADAMGAVCGDVTSRRGQVLGTRALPRGDLSIKALAPLGELSDFAGRFKSLTGGEGSYTVVFSHYEPAPGDLQSELAGQWTRHEED